MLSLPPVLTGPLSYVGLRWPEADEDRLAAAATAWSQFAQSLIHEAEQAEKTANAL